MGLDVGIIQPVVTFLLTKHQYTLTLSKSQERSGSDQDRARLDRNETIADTNSLTCMHTDLGGKVPGCPGCHDGAKTRDLSFMRSGLPEAWHHGEGAFLGQSPGARDTTSVPLLRPRHKRVLVDAEGPRTNKACRAETCPPSLQHHLTKKVEKILEFPSDRAQGYSVAPTLPGADRPI